MASFSSNDGRFLKTSQNTMANWHYLNKNGEKITVTGKELKQLALQGTITPETIVETEEGKTAPARKVNGLTFAVMAPTESKPSIAPYALAGVPEKEVQKSTSNYFYTDENGVKSPPISKQRLQVLIDRGTFTSSTLLETDTGHQIAAGQIPELNFNNVAPPPPVAENSFTVSVDKWYCTNCGNTILEQAVACMSCGAKPTGHKKFCRHCGVGLNPEQIVCIKCGHAVNTAEQQQLDVGASRQRANIPAKNGRRLSETIQHRLKRLPLRFWISLALLMSLLTISAVIVSSINEKQHREYIAWHNAEKKREREENVSINILNTIKKAQSAFEQCMGQISSQWMQGVQSYPQLGTSYHCSSAIQLARETGFYNGLDQYMLSIRENIKKLDKNKYVNTLKLYAILSQYEKAVNEPAGSVQSYVDDLNTYRREFTSVLSLAELGSVCTNF